MKAGQRPMEEESAKNLSDSLSLASRGVPFQPAIAFLWKLPLLRCLALQQPEYPIRLLFFVQFVSSVPHRSR
jgi:hypothetical protein